MNALDKSDSEESLPSISPEGSSKLSIPEDATQKIARVLTIDGGGVRGIYPSYCIKEFEKISGKKIKDCFHFISGNSTGGLIACGAEWFSGEEMCDIYFNESETLFKPRNFFARFFSSKYKSEPRIQKFKEYFGEKTLANLSYDSLIPFYDITQRKERFFKSHRARSSEIENYSIYDVLGCTSAAPTYFTPYELLWKGTASKSTSSSSSSSSNEIPKIRQPQQPELIKTIDGGLFANDPALYSLTEMLELYPNADSYTIISLGTGSFKEPLNPGSLLSWALAVPEICMSTDTDTVRHTIKEFGKSFQKKIRYLKIQMNIPKELSKMDNPSIVPQLYETAKKDDATRASIETMKQLLELPLTPRSELLRSPLTPESAGFVDLSLNIQNLNNIQTLIGMSSNHSNTNHKRRYSIG